MADIRHSIVTLSLLLAVTLTFVGITGGVGPA